MHFSKLNRLKTDYGIDIRIPERLSDLDITGITSDSRECRRGYIFAALPGANVDGVDYIDEAIENGADVILAPFGIKIEDKWQDTAFILHDNPRFILGHIAAKFYGKQPKNISVVTGTNGKTSVVHFCRQLWNALGHKSASIGTLGVVDENSTAIGGESLTTPGSVHLHKALANLVENGVNHVAMEASSHGLEQWRLSGVNIKVSAFTNISRDHLDYHETFENYFNAKMQLFKSSMKNGGVAVLNADIKEFNDILQICKEHSHKIISYGLNGKNIKLVETIPLQSGQEIRISINNKEYKLKTDLIGSFQASNVLCALGIIIGMGEKPEQVIEACESITPVCGRMETVAVSSHGAPILVDYAHTPDALEKVLQALKPHVQGKLLCVFGCGGDRDKGKRPIMGEISSRLADVSIVTDDNPRTEDADIIRKEIMEKCSGGKEIGDRAEAIKYAVSQLEEKDLLVIAGKGHEKYQIIGKEKHHFDDAEEALRAVEQT